MYFLANNELIGSLTPPFFKSEIHRALFIGVHSREFLRIDNITYSDDVKATLNVLSHFATILTYPTYCLIKKKEYSKDQVYNLEILESGTTIRFFLAFIFVFGIKADIKTSKRLIDRDLYGLKDLYQENDCTFTINDDVISFRGALKRDTLSISLRLSSQYASGLLITLSFCEQKTTLRLTELDGSLSYFRLTAKMLNQLTDVAYDINSDYYQIRKVNLRSANYKVSVSYSELAYILPFKFFNKDLTINNLLVNESDPNSVYLKFLSVLGFIFDSDFNLIKTEFKPAILDIADCPDLFLALLPLTLYTNKSITFLNVDRLKYKECDRLNSALDVLDKLGVKYEVLPNKLIIYPSLIEKKLIHLASHNDHRFCFFSALLTLLGVNVIIDDLEPVKKSYPNYFTDLKAVGFKLLPVDLNSLRSEIDRVDDTLFRLLNERFLLASLTKLAKDRLEKLVFDPKREGLVKEHFLKYNDAKSLSILDAILTYSKEIQKDETFLYNWRSLKSQ